MVDNNYAERKERVGMVDLYRFMRKNFAESFLEGNIYMSALGYFWANGFESQQDINEGIVQMQAPAQSPFPQELQSVITGSVRYRLEAYKYCNLLCMVMHHYNTQKKQTERFDPRMRDYGECAVRIIDIEEFLNRVFEKAKAQGDYCLAGPMNYLPFDSVRNGMDCFEKLLHFAWQKEWRIAYIHDQEKLKRLAEEDLLRTYEEPYTLQIGDISDIAEIVSTKDIFDTPQNTYKGYKVVDRVEPMIWPEELKRIGMPVPYQWSVASYCGWGDRPSFQNKIIEIDGGKLRPIFSI